jgi:hypothetical protein
MSSCSVRVCRDGLFLHVSVESEFEATSDSDSNCGQS